MITKREITLALFIAGVTANLVAQPAKPVMGSTIVDWNSTEAKTNKNGFARKFFESSTATLELLECHVTTLNPGVTNHPPNRHVQEEVIIVKEGTVEAFVNDGWKRADPGSVIFNASSALQAMRNVGDVPATYHVVMLTPGTSSKSDKPVMDSTIFDWNSSKAQPTKTGSRRQFFQAPTSTLDELECHVTTLNKGEAAHAPHQHPEEEIVIVKEGTLEILIGEKWKRCGAGSVIFHASNVLHGMRNVGDGQASYHVFKWFLPGTKKQPAK